MILFTKNEFHLGDNIFCCLFFSKIKKYIETNNIFINHYCLREHVNQTKEFIYSKNIKIFDLNEIPKDENIIDLWIGSSLYELNYFNSNKNTNYDVFLCDFYNNILKNNLKFPIVIEKFIFDNDDLDFLDVAIKINEKTNNKYTNIDLLIVNSTPLSGQMHYDKSEWDKIITLFHNKYDNVITTQKVEDVKCTTDDNLTAKDIAAISTNAKKIIAIDTGPAIGLYNKYTIQNATTYMLCGEHAKCNTSFFIRKHNIQDMMFLLEENKEGFFINSPNYEHIFLLMIILPAFIINLIFNEKISKLLRKMSIFKHCMILLLIVVIVLFTFYIFQKYTDGFENNFKICYITAIYGNYELSCKPFVEQTIKSDFICFTDNKDIQNNGWIIDTASYHLSHKSKLDNDEYLNSISNNKHTFNIAKYYKQQFQNIPRLKNYDVVVWLDGTIKITNSKTSEHIKEKIENYKIIGWMHEYRSGNLKEEVEASNMNRYTSTCWNGQSQPYQDIFKQYEQYVSDGYEDIFFKKSPNVNEHNKDNIGVWLTCFVAFLNKNDEVSNFLNLWYLQTLKYTTQDQISFPYVCYKTGIIPYTLPDEKIKGDNPHDFTDLYEKLDHKK